MSVTAGEVARAALADLNEPAAGFLNCLRWVSERYTQLAGRRLKQLRHVASLVVPAPVTDGTVTVTRDSNQVVGDATAQAAWSSLLVNRYFRTQHAWYKILALDGSNLVLDSVFAEDTHAAATYQIVQRYISLPPDAQFLGTFIHERLFLELEKWSLTELDMMAPERLYVTSGPRVVSEFGEDKDGNKLIEIYPYSTTTEHIAFTYWARPPKTMIDSTVLPGAITVAELKEGVLVDLKQHKMAQAGMEKDWNGAAFWRNEYRAQQTVWMTTVIPSIVKRDQGVEDKIVLQRSIHGRRFIRSIENSYDEIYARGSRP